MYNRYIGNTGKHYRVYDAPPAARSPRPYSPPPARAPREAETAREPQTAPARAPDCSPSVRAEDSSLAASGLEIGDVILLLVLFLLFIDSGDEEFLIILGFLAFTFLKG
jgi:hypothetical protein